LAHTRGVAPPKPKSEPVVEPEPKPELVKLSTVKGHKVKKGETLWRISQRYKVPLDELKKANGLKSNVIQIGQILAIPVT
jgi:N-acetylmuramoyl-L-alanine amidase